MVLGAVVFFCFCSGMIGPMVIIAFNNFTDHAKDVEAEAQLSMLWNHVQAYTNEPVADEHGGAPHPRGLPPSISATPSTLGTSKRKWPADADPMWTRLEFHPRSGVYFSYSIESDRGAGTIILRAERASINALTHIVEVHGHTLTTGEVVRDGVFFARNESSR